MFVTLLHVLFVCTSCSVGSTDGGGGSRRGLSIGLWEPDRGIVRISQQRGKHWNTHGHTHGGELVLLPEEALFLMECGALEILHESRPLHMQEAFHALLSQSPLHFYQVLASLKRVGFIAHKVYLLGASAVTPSPQQPSPRQPSPQQVSPRPAPWWEAVGPLSTSPACPLCSTDASAGHGAAAAAAAAVVGEERLVLLEVYKPSGSKKGAPFRKSNPGPPDFRVMIVRPGDEFPSGEKVRRLCSIQPLCPLRVCVVDGPSLTYYTLSRATEQTQAATATQCGSTVT